MKQAISQIATRITKINRLLLWLFVFPITCTPSAFATCTVNNVSITTPNLTFNQNSVAINATLGSELISSVQTIITCDRAGWRNIFPYASESNRVATINGKYIYKTSNPGVGFAFAFEPTSGYCTSAGIMWMSATSDLCSTTSITTPISLTGRYHLQFYKLANIVSSNNVTISSNPAVLLKEYSGTYLSNLTPTAFNVTVPTCSLSSASTTSVTLPKVYGNNFVANGITAGSTPFSITVNCPNPTNLNITFTDNNNLGNTSTVLSPLASSTAQGLGIQLKYNGNIISFGPDSAEPGTTNQIVLNGNLTGSQTFPFTAAYVRTGAVTGGTLAARATFTLSYQ